MTHEENVQKIVKFMSENKLKGWSYTEMARNTRVERKTIISIIRGLRKTDNIKRFVSSDGIVFFAWKDIVDNRRDVNPDEQRRISGEKGTEEENSQGKQSEEDSRIS